MNSPDPDITFTSENASTVANFLDVSCSIKNYQLIFAIYHKPTHSFSYLHYRSCHPQHTKNYIVLSLWQRNLNKLKSCLIQHGHPEKVLDYTMTKLFSPSFKSQNESTDYINFVQTYNPNTKLKKKLSIIV